MRVHSLSRLCAMICLVLTVHSTAVAQGVPGMPPGVSTTTLNASGHPLTCVSNNMPVIYTFDYTIGDVALTYFGNASTPTVTKINPSLLMMFVNQDQNTATFVLAHECGHAFRLSSNELDADCWAATEGVKQGWFSSSDLPTMQAQFANNPGNWSHPPGPVRFQHITSCMSNAMQGTPLIVVP